MYLQMSIVFKSKRNSNSRHRRITIESCIDFVNDIWISWFRLEKTGFFRNCRALIDRNANLPRTQHDKRSTNRNQLQINLLLSTFAHMSICCRVIGFTPGATAERCLFAQSASYKQFMNRMFKSTAIMNQLNNWGTSIYIGKWRDIAFYRIYLCSKVAPKRIYK